MNENENNAQVEIQSLSSEESDAIIIYLVRDDKQWKINLIDSPFFKNEQLRQQCLSQIKNIKLTAEIYYADGHNTYPLSWADLIPKYMKEEPRCPLDGAEYEIIWSANGLPQIKCPNHGSSD